MLVNEPFINVLFIAKVAMLLAEIAQFKRGYKQGCGSGLGLPVSGFRQLSKISGSGLTI